MDIAVHITFYYIESRLRYINKILSNLSAIPHNISVFIYSTKKLDFPSVFENVEVKVIHFNFLNLRKGKRFLIGKRGLSRIPSVLRQYIHPYYLTWKNRKYVKRFIDQYDVQIYLEDDISFTNAAFNYWLKYKDMCMDYDYNLGFLRVEVDEDNNKLFCSDLTKTPERIINIGNQLFLLNDHNPYCGFWIYDKEELKKFTESKEWYFKFKEYDIREKSAIGWHGLNMKRYKGTIIPLQVLENNICVTHHECKVHHLTNSYIGHSKVCRVEFPIQLKITTENKVQDV